MCPLGHWPHGLELRGKPRHAPTLNRESAAGALQGVRSRARHGVDEGLRLLDDGHFRRAKTISVGSSRGGVSRSMKAATRHAATLFPAYCGSLAWP